MGKALSKQNSFLWKWTELFLKALIYKTVGLLYILFQTTLPAFQSPEFSVTRQHEDFVWLHDTLTETEEYAGLIVSTS